MYNVSFWSLKPCTFKRDFNAETLILTSGSNNQNLPQFAYWLPLKYYSVHDYLWKWNKNCGSAVIKPVGEVLLPRISGTLSSSLCKHHQISDQHNYRPRIPREQYPCGFSHRLLRCGAHGVIPFSSYFDVTCVPLRQWEPVLNTLHHWKWNTTVCSIHGS